MSNKVKKLSVVYRSRRNNTTLYYWPRGNGRHVPGYVTSLHQINTALCNIYGCAELELHCVYNRRMHQLYNEENMKRALRYSYGSTLTIHAYDKRPSTPSWNLAHQELPVYIPRSSSSSLAECYHCRKFCSNETAYAYARNPRYKICGKCYRKLDFWSKPNWKQAAVYTDDIGIIVAPSAPLRRDMESVLQLQSILVYLGYIRKSDTSGMSYKDVVSITEEGVAKFRSKYRIYGKDMREYDLRTASKLGQVLRKSRKNIFGD